jgi:hypothetical protein
VYNTAWKRFKDRLFTDLISASNCDQKPLQ